VIRLPRDLADLASVHLAPLVSQGLVPSLAWAVVQGQDVAAGGAGAAGSRTIFQIGSVTKVFTALLLADMAERGEVRLPDPAASYLPGRRSLPDGAGPVGLVTLADLATHTSGFPRLPRGLFWSALLNPRDPYARYPETWFVRAARRALRAGSGGSPYVYSNFGYGLLGYLLGQAAGTAYQTLVTTRICVPLGLPDTTFEVPGPSRDRMAQGFQRGRAVPDWHLGALAGAGALYSTATDLARFLPACLAAATTPATSPAATPLEPAIRATLAPRHQIPGGEIGLAWHHTRRGDHRIIWHNGMTGGFSAMIAFDPARNLGVAALANCAGAPPSPLDKAVLGALS
jgi:D-alanyl-D-alanine-carboxypeptidase/D-alanyl-D-alanine-endopeptidase